MKAGKGRRESVLKMSITAPAIADQYGATIISNNTSKGTQTPIGSTSEVGGESLIVTGDPAKAVLSDINNSLNLLSLPLWRGAETDREEWMANGVGASLTNDWRLLSAAE